MTQSTTEQVNKSQKLSDLRMKLGQKAKNEPKFRFYTLYGHLCRAEVLQEAWDTVRRNGGAEGVDGVTIDAVKFRGEMQFLEEIRNELIKETYRPSPVRRVYIPKPNGKLRPLGIPTIKDRVVQTALLLIIEPIYEADFLDCSHGFRPDRNAHQAIEEIRKAVNRGRNEIYDADLKSYFDSIPHDKLIKAVEMRIVDRKVLGLIRMWLKTPIQEDKAKLVKSDKGTPQGGVISPLLANIYLHWFDKLFSKNMSKAKATLVRYADDMVILAKEIKKDLVEFIEGLLEQWMGLEVNQEKTRVVDLKQPKSELTFLGYRFRRCFSKKTEGHYCQMACSKDAEKRARLRIREKLAPQQNQSIDDTVKSLNKFLVGWGRYFCKGYPSKSFGKINYYASTRMIANLKRRSQRGYRTLKGRKWAEILDGLGVFKLRKGYYSHA